MIFEQSWRWYGPQDPVGLNAIKQAGARGVVTALHHIPVGEAWSVLQIKQHNAILEESNANNPFPLHWNVVESLPVHEVIKQGRPERDSYIEKYCESLQNLSTCGINTVCYNFMPVLDWLRTNVAYKLEDGSTALLHDITQLAIFDLFILKRENAEKDYDPEIISEAKSLYPNMSREELNILKQSLLMALPGDKEGFTLEKLRNGLEQYRNISTEQLQENLVYFLRKVIHVAEKYKVNLAIHPDDPPWPVFGLPRIVSTASDLEYIFKQIPQISNGLTFCSGSLGASSKNNLQEIIKKFYKRIHFVHLRSVERVKPGYFYEANHLEGSGNLFDLMHDFYECKERYNGKILPMRPDHGHQMLDDLGKITYPGYSAIGRLRGLAELRGLELGIIRTLERNKH